MKSKFRIDNPCSVNWVDLENLGEHKFCVSCKKNVYDTEKLSLEILTSSNGICGKITQLKPVFSSVFLAFTLATNSCTVLPQEKNASKVELNQNNITISGKIISKNENEMVHAEISVITLEKVYSAITNGNNEFSLKLPEKILNEQNVIRVDFITTDKLRKEYSNSSTSIISKTELMGLQNFIVENNSEFIGQLIYSGRKPPTFYYFDGKKVSKRKYNKIASDNPDFKNYRISDWALIKNLHQKRYLDNLYLLYSN